MNSSHGRSLVTAGARMALAGLFALAWGCTSTIRDLPPTDNTEPWDRITTSCDPGTGEISALRLRSFLAGGARPHPPDPWRPVRLYRNPRREKIYPALQRRLRLPGSGQSGAETLLVTYRETTRIPLFPSLHERESRATAANAGILLAIRGLIADIVSVRDSSYAADSVQLVALGGSVLHRHWLTHSLLVTLPLDSIPRLATRPNVVYIQPRVGIEPPPSCPRPACW